MNYKCCICGNDFDDYGNNPYPLCADDDFKSRCCDECNAKYVIMARIIGITSDERDAFIKSTKNYYKGV